MSFIFRNLTVKSLRQQFLGNFGLEKLEADQREVFKNIVHDVYAFYSNNNQEKTGDQGKCDLNLTACVIT